MSFDSFLKRPPIGESLEAVLLDFRRIKCKKRCLGGSKTLGVQLGPFWLLFGFVCRRSSGKTWEMKISG